MKTVTTFVLGLLVWTFASGQNCRCDSDTMLKEIISCDTIKFDNKAKLFWSFNCDSSWLTFQSPTKKKIIIFSLGDGLQNLTGRLGQFYIQEYKNTFLVQNNVISGCCSPPEFYLYDKVTGKLKKVLGRILYYSEDKTLPIIIGVTNSNYDSTSPAIYNSLTIYNIDRSKKYLIDLPNGQIQNALKQTDEMYPEYLFDEPVLNGTILSLTYLLKKRKDENDKPAKTIKIELKKYCS